MTEWIKSTFSGAECCVEVSRRAHAGEVWVRDSKQTERHWGVSVRTGPVLRFTASEWEAFLEGAKAGEFDHLAEGATRSRESHADVTPRPSVQSGPKTPPAGH